MRLSSVSSHDSGFISQDAFQSKSPSPMPPEAPNQVRAPVLAAGAAVGLAPSPPATAGTAEGPRLGDFRHRQGRPLV